MESFLRILGILLKAGLTALAVLVVGLISYFESTAPEPRGGWIVPILSFLILAFSFAALWKPGAARNVWEWAFKLLATAALLGIIWILFQSADARGDMREWYFAAAAGTMLLLSAAFLWPLGRSLFEGSWSGLLIALLFAWGFALLPWYVEQMPVRCAGRYAWACELTNRLNAVAGPWSVLAVYFVVVVSVISAGWRHFLTRRTTEHRELT